ncbi:hypothetical protein MHU86_8775 [Fragilaria crotonensis]|nr:hypothetical protein MHU86_8775 [Fragilaria crotonensis]
MTNNARSLSIVLSALISLLLGFRFLMIKQYHHELEPSNDIILQTGQSPKDLSNRTYISSSIDPVSVKRSLAVTHMTSEGTDTGSLRILYIITSLAEYNTGQKSTQAGSDRLQETLIPVMREGVSSMMESGYVVDVFLISHWKLRPERHSLIREALPPAVKFEYWDDASPLGYDNKLELPRRRNKPVEPDKHIQDSKRALARQHRYVIKDKLLEYDFFVAFEDDMLVKGELVSQNLKISQELARLEKLAPSELSDDSLNTTSLQDLEQVFHGPLTKAQLRRMMPGLMRVEVLLDEKNYPTQKDTGPIPVDLQFGNSAGEVHPEHCCRVSAELASLKLPLSPNGSKLFLWETGIKALGVRKMPEESTLDWVVLQRGPSAVDATDVIGDYWSGRDNEFGEEPRPPAAEPNYMNNMAGWMASRAEIWKWHTEFCQGGFLPPFDSPHFKLDGHYRVDDDHRIVEYWSGSLQLVMRINGCNLQRIIPVDPEGFSRHLIYHTANNKQRQLWQKRQIYFTKVNTMLGQLNTVRKRAERVYLNVMRPAL